MGKAKDERDEREREAGYRSAEIALWNQMMDAYNMGVQQFYQDFVDRHTKPIPASIQ